MAANNSNLSRLEALPTEILQRIMRHFAQPRFFDMTVRSGFSPPSLAHVSRVFRQSYLDLVGATEPPVTHEEYYIDQDRSMVKVNLRWLSEKDVAMETVIRSGYAAPIGLPMRIFQNGSRIRAFAFHVDQDAMFAYRQRQIFWQSALGGLPNLEKIILAFSILDRSSPCAPGLDPLTLQIDTMVNPGLPELVKAKFNVRYRGVLCGRPGVSCLGTVMLNGQDITNDISDIGSLFPMKSSILNWWRSRQAFVTARERKPRAPTVEICAIWDNDFTDKVKARYAFAYSRDGAAF